MRVRAEAAVWEAISHRESADRESSRTAMEKTDKDERTHSFASEILPQLDRIFALARVLAPRALDPEELTQETFARAYASYHRFRPGSDARAWLTTILLNLIRADARRRHPQMLPLAETELMGEQDCEVIALRNLQRSSVLAAVKRLPEDFRLAIGLVDLAGLPVKDAANVLGVPKGTVLSRLSRGRARLARMLSVDLAGSEGPGEL